MKKHFHLIFLSIFLIFLLLFPEITTSGAKKAVDLFIGAVFPALFPFLLIYNYLNITYKLPRCFLWGLFAGYPFGARMVNDFYDTLKHPAVTLTMFNLVSPNFVFSYVAYGLLKHTAYGFKILISVLLGTFITCLLCYGLFLVFPFTRQKKQISQPNIMESKTAANVNLDQTAFSVAVSQSMQTLFVFGAYLILCCIGSEAIQKLSFLTPLSKSLLVCLMEFTYGLSYISQNLTSTAACIPFCIFFLTFGSVSIFLQTLSCIPKKPSLLFIYIPLKLICACIAVIFYILFLQ